MLCYPDNNGNKKCTLQNQSYSGNGRRSLGSLWNDLNACDEAKTVYLFFLALISVVVLFWTYKRCFKKKPQKIGVGLAEVGLEDNQLEDVTLGSEVITNC